MTALNKAQEVKPVAYRWEETNSRGNKRWLGWRVDWSSHDLAKQMGCQIEYAYAHPTTPPANAQQVAVPAVNEDSAIAAAWEILKPQLGTKGWTVGDHCNYLGFFGWGWEARRKYTHPAPPPAGKCVHVGDALRMVGERAELIAKLRDKHKWEWGDDALKEAADMLEADAREMRLWAGTVESRDRNIAAVRAANVLLAQQVAVPEALPAGECFKNGNVCAKCGHGEFIVADSPPPPVATGERAELIAALRLVMDCAGDIQSASDAELENALSCGDTDTEKQANAWLVARNVLAQQVAVPAPVARVDSWTSGSYSRNYKITWLENVPAGTLLYSAAQGAKP